MKPHQNIYRHQYQYQNNRPIQNINQQPNYNYLNNNNNNNLLPSNNLDFVQTVFSQQIANLINKSTRKSYVMLQIPEKQRKNIQDVKVNKNTIRLKDTPNQDARIYQKKQGILLVNEMDQFCCFQLGKKDNKRKCKLDHNVFSIQKDTDEYIFVCLDTVCVQLKVQNGQFRIKFEGRQQCDLLFKADSEYETKQWIRVLSQAINHSYGKIHKLRKILSIADFQRHDYILENQFKKHCNSGDIILFKDNHTFAKVQRAITFSQYDHVAIVLKNKDDEVLLFESSSNSGVSFTFWKQLLRYKWYESIPRITWKRLNIQRNKQQLQIIQQFIKTNLDKQYGIDFDKLLKFKSKVNKTKQQQKNRTYFCSQLVAALYKKLSLIQKQKATTQYWPVDFSDSNNLKLLQGSLDHQRIIIFQQSLLFNKKK